MSESEQAKTLAFDYLKSRHFRVVCTTGAYGAIGPNREIVLSLYNERPAIPQRTVHHVDENGILGEEDKEQRITRGSIVRELECSAMMDIATAEAVAKLLLEKVELAKNAEERLQKIIEERPPK